jgi:hypothetical protein
MVLFSGIEAVLFSRGGVGAPEGKGILEGERRNSLTRLRVVRGGLACGQLKSDLSIRGRDFCSVVSFEHDLIPWQRCSGILDRPYG